MSVTKDTNVRKYNGYTKKKTIPLLSEDLLVDNIFRVNTIYFRLFFLILIITGWDGKDLNVQSGSGSLWNKIFEFTTQNYEVMQNAGKEKKLML